ncbi:MAG: Dyp-type peroxidase [Solirubrobacteraceae bacterium]
MAGAGGRLELRDIQGDVLRAYGNDYKRTSYLFVGIGDPARGRGWLGGLVDRVTTAEQSAEKAETHLNLAVTHAGIAALGVPERLRSTFSEEFRQGMAGRAELLGDTGQSSPTCWDPGLGTGAAHVLVTINAKTTPCLDRALLDLRAGMQAAGVVEVAHEPARVLPGVREHFGFADGSAQPAVEGVTDHKTRGGGVPEPGGRWRPLAPGEFILGYPDEDTRVDPQGRLPSAPDDPLGRNGTYMVYRKLHQDVALFRSTLRESARLYHDGDEEKLAAKVVGRWHKGTPLEKSPDAPDPNFDPAAPGANDFRYLDRDSEGHRCPLGAHIRRSNPRDALGWKGLDESGLLTFRHRIIRRGMPYGLPLPEGVLEDDGKDRGLVFVCFNASISRQFESVQIQWLNDGNAFRLGHDKDFLLGDSGTSGKMTVQGRPPFFLSPQRPFVTTRGGEYLFVPGIRALRALAEGVGG